MKIEIPFREDIRKRNLERIASGKTGRTRRYKKYGKVGDVFALGEKEMVLTDVYEIKLSDEALREETVEEFGTSVQFVKIWSELHPRKGFRPSDVVWVHEFKEMKK